jgi:hypothetical protein
MPLAVLRPSLDRHQQHYHYGGLDGHLDGHRTSEDAVGGAASGAGAPAGGACTAGSSCATDAPSRLVVQCATAQFAKPCATSLAASIDALARANGATAARAAAVYDELGERLAQAQANAASTWARATTADVPSPASRKALFRGSSSRASRRSRVASAAATLSRLSYIQRDASPAGRRKLRSSHARSCNVSPNASLNASQNASPTCDADVRPRDTAADGHHIVAAERRLSEAGALEAAASAAACAAAKLALTLPSQSL